MMRKPRAEGAKQEHQMVARRWAVLAVVGLLSACTSGPPALQGSASQTSPPSPTAPGSTNAEVVNPLTSPERLAVDAAGSLYVSDICTHRVLHVSPAGDWSIFAGTGEAGYSGDGGPATAAMIEGPTGLTVDGQGNLYIVEGAGNVVRRVGPDGIITTVAGLGGKGEGQGGYSGDGGPATEAELNWPVDGTIDESGNIYIADRDNSVIRKVDGSGAITTFAGGGTVDTVSAGPPYEGPATEARFGPETPVSVVVDAA